LTPLVVVLWLFFLASLMFWCRNEAEIGVEAGGCANSKLKSQWRPSQSRKESILNCLLIGSEGFIHKSKGGIGSARSDQENIGPLYTKVKEGSDQQDWIKKISDLSEEGKILAGNNCSGSENSCSLFRWTYNYLEEKLNNGSLFETTLSL